VHLAHMLTESQCLLCPGHVSLSFATVCQLWKLKVLSLGKLHISITSESGGICSALMKQLAVGRRQVRQLCRLIEVLGPTVYHVDVVVACITFIVQHSVIVLKILFWFLNWDSVS